MYSSCSTIPTVAVNLIAALTCSVSTSRSRAQLKKRSRVAEPVRLLLLEMRLLPICNPLNKQPDCHSRETCLAHAKKATLPYIEHQIDGRGCAVHLCTCKLRKRKGVRDRPGFKKNFVHVRLPEIRRSHPTAIAQQHQRCADGQTAYLPPIDLFSMCSARLRTK